MGVKPTSVLAYRRLIESGRGRFQRDRVFACLMKHTDDGFALCRDQIGTELNIRINAVCGRVRELLDMEMIEVAYKAKSPTPPHNEVEFLQVKLEIPLGEQMSLLD